MNSAIRWTICVAILLQGILPLSVEAGRRSRRCWCHAQPMNYAAPAMATPTAAAIAPAPEAALYERLGGEAAIKAVVDDFVGRAAGNPKVNFTRKGTDKEWKATGESVDVLKKHLVQLIAMVTGGPQKYEGRDMKSVHQGMKITDEEFNALAGDLKASLDHFKVPAREQDELLKIVGSTRGDIVEAK